MSTFGDNMKRIREKKGITKANLATVLNISPSAISFYEKGEREPNLENLKKIAACLNVPIDELLEYKFDVDKLEPYKITWRLSGWQVNVDETGRVHVTKERGNGYWSTALLPNKDDNSPLSEAMKKYELENPIEAETAKIEGVVFDTIEEFITVTKKIDHKAFISSLPMLRAAVDNAIFCKLLKKFESKSETLQKNVTHAIDG